MTDARAFWRGVIDQRRQIGFEILRTPDRAACSLRVSVKATEGIGEMLKDHREPREMNSIGRQIRNWSAPVLPDVS